MATIAQLNPLVLDMPKFTTAPTLAEMEAADAEARNAKAVADFNQLKVAGAKDADARAKRIRQLAQESGGDYEVMLPRLRTEDPEAAVEFETALAKQRAEAFKAGQEELKRDAAETEQGAGYLRALIGLNDPAAYAAMRPIVAQKLPELGQLLPADFNPDVLKEYLTLAETQQDYNTRNQAALQLIANGKFHEGAGLALSAATSAEEWNEAVAGMVASGVPKWAVQVYGQWQGPQSAERAGLMAMSPDARADNAREDAKFEYGKGKDAIEQGMERERIGIARGGLDVARGNLAVRQREASQPKASAGSASDEDVKAYADAYMAGDTSAMNGLIPTLAGKVGAEVLRRGGKLPDRFKLSVDMTNKVLRAEEGVRLLRGMKDDFRPEWVGPLAQYKTRATMKVPGVTVDPGMARFMAREATLKSAMIQAITGAAVGIEEEERILSQLPRTSDKPEVWQQKYATSMENFADLHRRTLELAGASEAQIAAAAGRLSAGEGGATPVGRPRKPIKAELGGGWAEQGPDGKWRKVQ